MPKVSQKRSKAQRRPTAARCLLVLRRWSAPPAGEWGKEHLHQISFRARGRREAAAKEVQLRNVDRLTIRKMMEIQGVAGGAVELAFAAMGVNRGERKGKPGASAADVNNRWLKSNGIAALPSRRTRPKP